jgi:omega-6 fatty acid desaturase (delta-12 desaturase)
MHVTPDERPLLAATRPYAREQATRTLFETAQTFLVLGLCLALSAAPLAWPLRLLGSVLAGLAIVRGFILYHDARHGAIFRGRSLSARLGRAMLWAYGILVLTPPTVWTREPRLPPQDHTAKIVGSHDRLLPARHARHVELDERHAEAPLPCAPAPGDDLPRLLHGVPHRA